jgi:hypothetical protein
MSGRSDPATGAQLPLPRDGHARVSQIGSALGGGWNSRIPTPGGVMEEGRRRCPQGAGA